jgi:pectate lyase
MEGLCNDPDDSGNVTDRRSTTGGNGGTVTTVSTLPQFTAAVNEKNTAPVIVVVKGVISGAVNVRIGSNKSVIGLPGSGRFSSNVLKMVRL